MERKPLTWITIVPEPIECMICEKRDAAEILKSGNEGAFVNLLACKRCADLVELIVPTESTIKIKFHLTAGRSRPKRREG